MFEAVTEALQLATDVFAKKDPQLAFRVEPLEKTMDELMWFGNCCL